MGFLFVECKFLRSMASQNLQLWFSGQVQGVGFRFTSAQVARGFEISGWVKNLADGRVQMEIQGEADVLRAYLLSLEKAIMGRGEITQREQILGQIDPTLIGFEIRR